MKLYTQADFDQNKAEKRREITKTLLMALPFLIVAIAGFALRIELLCTAGCILFGAVIIFMYDAGISPAVRYGRYLKEVHSGMSRRTLGTLMRIGSDPVYTDGVDFFEVIVNVYEDLSEEGDRRFLLDCKRSLDEAWVGRDVVVTSHGSNLLEAELYEA